jgi:hypothetical protein
VPHLVGGQLVPALDPAGLPPAREAVGTDPGHAERLGELGPQQRDHLVGLVAPVELGLRGQHGIQRRLDVGHVQNRGTRAGEEEGQPAAAQQPELVAPGGQQRVDLAPARLVALVHVLDDDLSSVRACGMPSTLNSPGPGGKQPHLTVQPYP